MSGSATTREPTLRLSIPARHDHGRIARAAVTSIALNLGFGYREVEDLRLAVDETLIFLLGLDRPGQRLAIRCYTGDHEIEVQVVPEFEVAVTRDSRSRFEELVAELVDAWVITTDGGVTLLKRTQHPLF